MIIFGLKGYETLLGVVTLVCSFCHHPAAQRVARRVTRFTVFFIPLFPVSTRHDLQCAMCGATSRLEADEAERLVAVPGGGRSASMPADLRKGQQGPV